VLLIAALGFVNYVLWKIYGPRSIDITSFLGGLVNSTAAVAELSSRVREAGEGFVKPAYRGVNAGDRCDACSQFFDSRDSSFPSFRL
jgi:uncharacterized membrane protein (DUF4010 family)